MGKNPPANHILLEVDFTAACPVQKSFCLIFCSEKRTHSRHLSLEGRYGAASPLGRYLGESTGRTAVLPPSKFANLFFEGYSKKEHFLVW